MRRALAVVIAAAFWPFTTTAQSVPKIDIVYPPGGSLFDRGCQKITGKAADPDRIAKVVAKQPEFQAAWEEFGPTYLRTAIEIVGRPFPYPAMQVALTVCEIGGVGMSMPLMIAPERFMRDRNDPLGYHEMWEFAEITFHELMHNYARDTYETSALR